MKIKQEYLKTKIPFNKPHFVGKAMEYIQDVKKKGAMAGDHYYTNKCHNIIEKQLNADRAFLTHSCTAALEMMALIIKLKPGSEVIMPSYTFVTTASAFVMHGMKPVFVDIREDTLNIDEKLIQKAITKKTKAIMAVHYAGVGCEMEIIKKLAKEHNLILLEDAAQAYLSKYKDKYLGTIGDLGAFSFHETKNIISGEGGSLTVNNNDFSKRAEIIREKGTNRSAFFRGEVDKYTWVDIGSSYLPNEITAAFLYSQLENSKKITKKRLSSWNRYHSNLEELENANKIKRPFIPNETSHNGHMYYIILKNLRERSAFIKYARSKDVLPVFHYVPLHSSPAGRKYTESYGKLEVTDRISETLVRLPLFYDITETEIDKVCTVVKDFFDK